MVVFAALTWEASDFEDSDHIINIFGRTEDGKSVCVSTSFSPYFFIKLPKGTSDTGSKILFDKIKKACPTVKSYSIIKSKDVWGFQNNEKFPFMKLDFPTLAAMRMCDSKLRYPLRDETYTCKVYESNIEPMLRLMHRSGIQSTGWLDSGSNCVRSQLSKTNIDLFCNDWHELKPVARDDIAPFIIASFDIETNSSTGKFPDADIEDDACFQIAVTLKRQGSPEIYEKTCLCYKQTSPRDDCTIVSYSTELELLMGFKEYIIKHDIDVMTGWNIFGFDLEYIFKRSIMVGCPEDFYQMSKLKDRECKMVYKKLSSSALGDNTLKLLPMPGRFIFDLFHEVKREQKLDSYSLNFVSKHFLGDQKIDMSPKEMFKRFREEDPDKLSEVAEYCVKDTTLPHQIMDKLCTFMNLIEMAKATWVPLCYLSERGQQIKVFSQMARKARELGFMIPTIRYGKVQSDAYEGATVLSAQTGAYYTPITALDFEGLYPSIMIAHNLCYSTLVMDPKFDSLPGINYESFTVGEKTYKFAQDVPSLLPAVLLELKAFRKQAKKDMANAADSTMKNVYNGKQLAYKVSMNSVYGFTGAGKGILPCVPIASTVTCKGRSMIEETKNYVEEHFEGAKVRYGDSVTGDTPLLLKINGVVIFERIDKIGNNWVTDEFGKQFSKSKMTEVWTESGWTPVQNIIRHMCSKKLFRIKTESGCVCVTEDHSLLNSTGMMMKPKNVKIGDHLLHSFPTSKKTIPKPFQTPLICIDSVTALGIYHTYQTAGWNVLVEFIDGDYLLTPRKESCDTAIISIEEIEQIDDFVYDLTTENHHFHAGVGSLIVHNTDSVRVEFDTQGRTGVEAIEYSWKLGEQAAMECSALFKKPNNLELEKVYCPYFLYSKKRYAAKLWTKDKSGQMKMNYIDVKGLQVVRRDNTLFVREVCKELLDVILESNNPEGAITLAKRRAVELLDGRVPNDKLVLSQKLADAYKSCIKDEAGNKIVSTDCENVNLPHVAVVRKMREREPGSEPQSGDRVQFVLIDTGNPNAKQFEKSEDPVWVLANNIPLDYNYYFTNKFMNPVCDLLEPIVEKDLIFGDLIPKKPKASKKKDPKQPSISDLFAKKKV